MQLTGWTLLMPCWTAKLVDLVEDIDGMWCARSGLKYYALSRAPCEFCDAILRSWCARCTMQVI